MPTSRRLAFCALGLFVFYVNAVPAGEPALTEALDALRAESEIADIAALDATHVWAVGDRGAIWHTDDGGQHWRLQPSGVSCRLESVQFVDATTGWAAGGWSQPYGSLTSSVLLRTRDGGEHWTREAKLLLPAIKQIKFFNASQGWAIGQGSTLFPSGVFFTTNGGHEWTPLPARGFDHWLAGDFWDMQTGTLSGTEGCAAVRRQNLESATAPPLGLKSIRRLKMASPQAGWAVGDGGLVLQTVNAGRSWQHTPDQLPAGVEASFDFATVEARGPQCWIAGTPGTRVLHSTDGGQTWDSQATGQTLPLKALTFADDLHGWAGGALGTILATHDGGKSWQVQRMPYQRAAVLTLLAEPRDMPLELLTKLTTDEGYITHVTTICRRDLESPTSLSARLPINVHEAIVELGGVGSESAWRFPLRQQGVQTSTAQIEQGWDQAGGPGSAAELQAYLVRQIRTWRPDVLITHDSGGVADTTNPEQAAIAQAVLQAVEQASDGRYLPDRFGAAGLEPWSVKRVLAILPAGQRGAISLSTAQVSPHGNQSLAESVERPRSLLAADYIPAQPTVGFRWLVNRVAAEASQADVMAGLGLVPGGPARRALVEPPADGLDRLNRAAQQRRNLRAILAQTQSSAQQSASLLATMEQLTAGLDENSAGELLFQLAHSYHQRGQWESAAQTFEMLAHRFPNHTLAGPAEQWLLQYYASGEAAWRGDARQQFVQRSSDGSSTSGLVRATHQISGPGEPRAADGETEKEGELSASNASLQTALRWGQTLQANYPLLAAEPSAGFSLAAAQRASGVKTAFYQNLHHTRPHDAWWTCAAAEVWLEDRRGECPKSIWRCSTHAARPKLDGVLDDEVWKSAQRIELTSAQHDDEQWPAVAMLAADQEFLYIAVTCREAPGVDYTKSSEPRQRDADLRRHDRVDLLLDVDRDYATYYRLTIDQRGWTADSCWGDATWNPTWFVAVHSQDGAWTAEAAIPWQELTRTPPGPKQVWAVGIQRTVPGAGFQSWTTPASTEIRPEGFGYLIFE